MLWNGIAARIFPGHIGGGGGGVFETEHFFENILVDCLSTSLGYF